MTSLDAAGTKDVIRRGLAYYREHGPGAGDYETLPLVERFQRAHPAAPAFAGVHALFVQHHLAPLGPRLRAMEAEGLDPERCWRADIPYSTHEKVVDRLHARGYARERAPPGYQDPLGAYSAHQVERVQGILRDLVERARSGKVLIVDDGAYFLRALDALPAADRARMVDALRGRIAIVEQTTRGYRHIQERTAIETIHALDAPVVSIARSYAKSYLEGPFIGASVARGLTRFLGAHPRAPTERFGNVLIIGYGKVGEATTDALRALAPAARVEVFDTDPTTAASVRAAGAHPLRHFPEEGAYDLVVGCTGYASFPLERRTILADGAVLASGSSASIELNREGFVELADRLPDDEIEIIDKARTDHIHATIRMRDRERTFEFLNAGFPVNFTGEAECLPALLIQPTHGLLFAAARQALASSGAGISFLRLQDDLWLYRHGVEEIDMQTARR